VPADVGREQLGTRGAGPACTHAPLDLRACGDSAQIDLDAGAGPGAVQRAQVPQRLLELRAPGP